MRNFSEYSTWLSKGERYCRSAVLPAVTKPYQAALARERLTSYLMQRPIVFSDQRLHLVHGSAAGFDNRQESIHARYGLVPPGGSFSTARDWKIFLDCRLVLRVDPFIALMANALRPKSQKPIPSSIRLHRRHRRAFDSQAVTNSFRSVKSL